MKKFICGKNSVLDAIENGIAIKMIYTSKPHLIKKINSAKIKVVKNSFLNSLTRENHQGFIAEIAEFNYFNIDEVIIDKPNIVLMLDHLQDPRNFGAILRSANAFGVKHVIIPKNRSVKMTPAAAKVSSGGYVGIKIIRVNSLINAAEKLRKNSFWIYSSSLQDGENIKNVILNKPTCLIIGNEEKGVSKTLLKFSDKNIFIEMSGTVQSLNASSAASILLYLCTIK